MLHLSSAVNGYSPECQVSIKLEPLDAAISLKSSLQNC